MPASFCSFCGTQVGSIDTSLSWKCSSCSHPHHQSPIPVAIAVVPIIQEDGAFVGVLGVVHKNNGLKMLLPTGLMEIGEDAVSAAARQVFEHTGLLIDLDDASLMETHSSENGQELFLFSQFPAISWNLFNRATSDMKNTDLVVLDTTTPLEFDVHEKIVRQTCANFFRPRKNKM